MARKSNKTAHVLNLIAGHDNQQEATEEAVSGEDAPAPAQPQPAAPAPAAGASAQNISVIDTTAEDPVADLIQRQLTNQFDGQTDAAPAEPEAQPQEHTEPQPEVQTKAEPEIQPEAQAQPEPEAQAQPEPEAQPEAQAQPEPETQPEAQARPEPETQPEAQPEAQAQPEPEIALAPDFARVNVMEEIVNDKIIYFMRQFDVCTCDRCVADTCALTLSGLLPKYIVTTPAAVDPLLSFYTNRYISDVTVEATKACMVVKDNPRH